MSKWLLSILLIAGIAVGQQKKVIVKKKFFQKDSKEQTVDVVTDGDEMTIIVEQDGEKKEYTVNLNDKKALKEIKEKLADMDVNIKTMVMDDDNVYTIRSGGYLGVQIQELTKGLREYFKVNDDNGVLISEVVDDSPAAKAKLKAGDIILSVNGDDVSTTSELQRAIRRQDPGSEVNMEVVRKGRKRDFTATLGSQKNNFSWTGRMPRMKFDDEDHDVFFFSPEGLDFERQEKHLENHLKKGAEKFQKEYKFRMVSPGQYDDLREEIEKLRKELKELRKEIKKLKKS